jgi:predicted RNA-binding protein with PIN domain
MNVIGSRPDGWWRDRVGAQRRLVDELAGYGGEEEVTVVFDGRPWEAEPGGARAPTVRFASRRGPNAADDDIVALVAAAPDPSAVTVVTSDADLSRRARALGAEVLGAGAFRRRLEATL